MDTDILYWNSGPRFPPLLSYQGHGPSTPLPTPFCNLPQSSQDIYKEDVPISQGVITAPKMVYLQLNILEAISPESSGQQGHVLTSACSGDPFLASPILSCVSHALVPWPHSNLMTASSILPF